MKYFKVELEHKVQVTFLGRAEDEQDMRNRLETEVLPGLYHGKIEALTEVPEEEGKPVFDQRDMYMQMYGDQDMEENDGRTTDNNHAGPSNMPDHNSAADPAVNTDTVFVGNAPTSYTKQ